MFPQQGINEGDIEEFNEQTRFDWETTRDFIILHYKVTHRDDSPFWRHCRNIDIPEKLKHRIELFESTGRILERITSCLMTHGCR